MREGILNGKAVHIAVLNALEDKNIKAKVVPKSYEEAFVIHKESNKGAEVQNIKSEVIV